MTLDPRRDATPSSELRLQRYEPPQILHRESLEAMAAECTGFPGGKSDPTCVVGFS